jgi:hypothetical protein
VACGKAVLRADELVEYSGASLSTYCNCATFIASFAEFLRTPLWPALRGRNTGRIACDMRFA